MDIFAKVLQGPYAYLLILQVLVVSGLCLTLIYLIMLRLREAPATPVSAHTSETKLSAVQNETSSAKGAHAAAEEPLASVLTTVDSIPAIPPLPVPPAASPTFADSAAIPMAVPTGMPALSFPQPNGVSMEPAAGNGAPTDSKALQAERERAASLEQEAAMSKDKVRYLESKLLEYEILQEEIGTLSTLKLENEKLRQELMSVKSSPSGAPAAMSELVGATTGEVPAAPLAQSLTTPIAETPPAEEPSLK